MQVFVSYTRTKNDTGAVTKFVKRFKTELRLLIPDAEVFQDTEDLTAGDRYKAKILRALHDSDVLLVLVSPAWLKSNWCRSEFTEFSAKKKDQGKSPHIVSVLWVKTPTLKSTSEDQITRELEAIQHVDLHETRYDEKWSERGSVRAIAERVVKNIPEQQRRIESQENLEDARNYLAVGPGHS